MTKQTLFNIIASIVITFTCLAIILQTRDISNLQAQVNWLTNQMGNEVEQKRKNFTIKKY